MHDKTIGAQFINEDPDFVHLIVFYKLLHLADTKVGKQRQIIADNVTHVEVGHGRAAVQKRTA
jgi:hypothetical protein